MRKPHRTQRASTPGRSALGPENGKLEFEVAAPWPVFECLISAWWRDSTQLTHIIIAKEPPFGGVVCCALMVDLGCLGLKEGFVTQFRTRHEYQTEFLPLMTGHHPMIAAEYPLAAKVIVEAARYAAQLGFEVPPRTQRALAALGSLEVAAGCHEKIPLGGHDGLPYFVAGPDDDTAHILATLQRTCGPGKFHFTAPSSPFPPGFFGVGS